MSSPVAAAIIPIDMRLKIYDEQALGHQEELYPIIPDQIILYKESIFASNASNTSRYINSIESPRSSRARNTPQEAEAPRSGSFSSIRAVSCT